MIWGKQRGPADRSPPVGSGSKAPQKLETDMDVESTEHYEKYKNIAIRD